MSTRPSHFARCRSRGPAAAHSWCPRRDSNPEPTDYESAALTIELQGHKNLWVMVKVYASASSNPCPNVWRDECSTQPRSTKSDEISRIRYKTARSVISSPLSMIANASRSSASVIHNGGFVKKVFQRTNV